VHEYSVVQQLVERLLVYLRERGIGQVTQVRVRRDSTFSADALRQSYELLTRQTALEGAGLVIEEFAVEHTCSECGHKQTIASDDLIHHLFFCPACGAADEIEEAHGLSLLGVTVADSE